MLMGRPERHIHAFTDQSILLFTLEHDREVDPLDERNCLDTFCIILLKCIIPILRFVYNYL